MIKKILKFTAIISAVSTTIHSPDLLAQNAISFIPKVVWQRQAQNFLLEQSTFVTVDPGPLRYETANPEIKVNSGQTEVSSQLSISRLFSAENGLTEIQINALNVKAIAHQFDFSAIIRHDMGFGLANLRINVKCFSIQVESLQPITVKAVVTHGQNTMTFEDFNFHLNPEALKVSLKDCTEVSGFDELLKTELVKLIKNELIANLIKDVLNQKAKAWLTGIMDQAIKSAIRKFNIFIDVHSYLDQDGDLWIRSNQSDGDILSLDDLNEIKSRQKPVLLVSKIAVENNVSSLINQKLETMQISSDTVSGLRKITCSRFFQFFLWPSLMSLNKCFPLQFINRSNLVKLIDVKNLTFEININSWAQNRDGVHPSKDLAFFQTRFQTELLTGQTRLVNLSAKSFQPFINWSHSSNRISTSFVKSAIESSLSDVVKNARKNVDLQKILSSTTFKEFKKDHVIVDLNDLSLK